MAKVLALALLLVLPQASVAFIQGAPARASPQRSPAAGRFLPRELPQAAEGAAEPQSWFASFLGLGAALGLVAALAVPAPSRALTAEQYSQLTYNQVKG
eukprot:CAMPEP_0171198404 /NCGR_PEP_ID=MMETSP0790-20130122/22921_1 /TAXON_ID=2925 /ORGANISM="Alexandrium catenella, Strain OF101" /LENGTH=98 /DNA_ID=CAMNT_0011663699 /DNA_START=60 /DNA_END=352 /DNA_ORIENTATION=-